MMVIPNDGCSALSNAQLDAYAIPIDPYPVNDACVYLKHQSKILALLFSYNNLASKSSAGLILSVFLNIIELRL